MTTLTLRQALPRSTADRSDARQLVTARRRQRVRTRGREDAQWRVRQPCARPSRRGPHERAVSPARSAPCRKWPRSALSATSASSAAMDAALLAAEHARSVDSSLRRRSNPPSSRRQSRRALTARITTAASRRRHAVRAVRRSISGRPNTGDKLRSGARVKMGRRGHEPAPPTGHGAGESFVSFIALFGSAVALLGRLALGVSHVLRIGCASRTLLQPAYVAFGPEPSTAASARSVTDTPSRPQVPRHPPTLWTRAAVVARGSAAATNARILAKHSVDVTQLNGHVFGTPDVEPAATATTTEPSATRSRSRRRRAPPSVLVADVSSPIRTGVLVLAFLSRLPNTSDKLRSGARVRNGPARA